MDFNKGNGLIPVVIQDAWTHEVLMLGTMNRESWQKTLQTKRVSFWSRSRRKLWVKGETSGHTQEVKEIYLDCEGSPGFDLFENESVAGPVGTGGG